MTTSELEPSRRPGGRKIGIAVDLREGDRPRGKAGGGSLPPPQGHGCAPACGRPRGSKVRTLDRPWRRRRRRRRMGSRRQMEERAKEIGKALEEAGLEYGVRIVKDKEMKERECLEVERLGLSGLVMGRGRRKLGSVSGYCIKHCVCSVVVVQDDDDDDVKLGAVPEEKEEEEEAKV